MRRGGASGGEGEAMAGEAQQWLAQQMHLVRCALGMPDSHKTAPICLLGWQYSALSNAGYCRTSFVSLSSGGCVTSACEPAACPPVQAGRTHPASRSGGLEDRRFSLPKPLIEVYQPNWRRSSNCLNPSTIKVDSITVHLNDSIRLWDSWGGTVLKLSSDR